MEWLPMVLFIFAIVIAILLIEISRYRYDNKDLKDRADFWQNAYDDIANIDKQLSSLPKTKKKKKK